MLSHKSAIYSCIFNFLKILPQLCMYVTMLDRTCPCQVYLCHHVTFHCQKAAEFFPDINMDSFELKVTVLHLAIISYSVPVPVLQFIGLHSCFFFLVPNLDAVL
jgi:hypothetical protein